MGIEEFYRFNDLLSIRFYENSYFVGSAHPNHRVWTLNFGGELIGEFNVRRLLGCCKDGILNIFDYCKNVIIAGLEENDTSEHLFLVNNYDNESILDLLSEFNFDRRGVTFNFSPYSLLPYAYGIQQAFVPWEVIFQYAKYVSEEEQKIIERILTSVQI